MRKLAHLATVSAFMALSGCSSTILGSDQVLLVQTSDGVDAHCVLQNGSDAWTTGHTPAYVSISRSSANLRVTCKALNGEHGEAVVSSSLDAKAVVVGAVSGAAIAASPFALTSTPFLLGSGQPFLLGVGHTAGDLAAMTVGGATASVGGDAATGALFKYDARVIVPMVLDRNLVSDMEPYVPMVGVIDRPAPRSRSARPVHHTHVPKPCACTVAPSRPSGS